MALQLESPRTTLPFLHSHSWCCRLYFGKNLEPHSSDRSKELQWLLAGTHQSPEREDKEGKKELLFVRMNLSAESYQLLSHQGLLLIKIFSGKSLLPLQYFLVMSKDGINRSRSSSRDEFSVCVLLPAVFLQSTSALFLALSP